MGRKSFLFFSLILGFQSAFADEIVNDNDRKQIMSSIKDVEVTEILKKTSEYSECAEKYTYSEGADQAQRSKGLAEAQDCFLKKINQTNDPKKLEELSNKLSLQQYGLVENNNTKEIREYLTDKLYEALTGVNRKEKDQKKLIESMKFDKKKQVDQSVFLQLYKSQLGKNALMEISRFCFEKLRSTEPSVSTKTTFHEHWSLYVPKNLSLAKVTDTGDPPFTTFSATNDTNTIYKDIFSSLQSDTFGINKLQDFFGDCGNLITDLCDEYKKSSSVDASSTESYSDSSSSSSPRGAAACLTRSRIQEYKKAIASADKVLKDMGELSQDQVERLKLVASGVKIYGNDSKDQGIDELTNIASSSTLQGDLDNKEVSDLENECINSGSEEACSQFIVSKESLEKSKHNIELQMTLKREVEKKRVAELKNKGDEDLKKYLEENGFMDLVKDDAYKTKSVDELKDAIGKSFEAKKTALLLEINNKLGKRQAAKNTDIDTLKTTAQKGIQEAKEEKVRLAQVVLFHNIISSFLTVTKENDKSIEGRNVEAWSKEEKALADAKVDPSLFQNIKASNDSAEKIDLKATGMDFKILDEFLK